MHGGSWFMLDKDLGTRPFFRQLAAQGHVIMDVAYRLHPETDLKGMVNDVNRAIVWMKENAALYKVDPDHIVVGGGSAGGHLALMAAYTTGKMDFVPKEYGDKDMSVCGVISIYGPSDLEEMYYHTNQDKTTRSVPGESKKSASIQMPESVKKWLGEDYHRLGFDKDFEKSNFAPMLGGHPDEKLDIYEYYSPKTYVHPGCPPTLLIHGDHDAIAPVKSTRELYANLVKAKVQMVMNIIPQSDHAFDLILPKISPSAHNAIYDVERFLALMANKEKAEKKTADLKSVSINTQRPAVLQMTEESD
jgi:acetyl esterase/lipase